MWDIRKGVRILEHLSALSKLLHVLDDMFQVCKEYLKYLSSLTIVCSLRDLVEDYSWSRSNQAMPENQKERYENLIAILTKQGISRFYIWERKSYFAHSYSTKRGIAC